MPTPPKHVRAAHIKRNTEGTSNEISFDVLDAARQSLDGKKPGVKQKLLRLSGGVPQISLSFGGRGDVSRETSRTKAEQKSEPFEPAGRNAEPARSAKPSRKLRKDRSALRAKRVAAPSETKAPSPAASAQDLQGQAVLEVERRKRRRIMKRAARAALAVLAVAAIAAGGYMGYTYVKEDKSSEAMFSQVLEKIGETDATLAALDPFTEDPVKAVEKGTWSAAQSDISEARESLDEAAVLLRQLSSRRLPKEVSASMDAAQRNVDARTGMIGAAERVMEKAAAAQDPLKRLRSAWSNLQEGDTLAREAAALSSKAASVDEIKDVRERGERATERFNDALDGFSSVAAAVPGIKLDPYIDYVKARLEALGYADAADAALIERNKDEAVEQNDLYTEADEKASRLAKNLPSSVDQVILDFMKTQSLSEIEGYQAARAEATQSDADLRDYLGAQSK